MYVALYRSTCWDTIRVVEGGVRWRVVMEGGEMEGGGDGENVIMGGDG